MMREKSWTSPRRIRGKGQWLQRSQ